MVDIKITYQNKNKLAKVLAKQAKQNNTREIAIMFQKRAESWYGGQVPDDLASILPWIVAGVAVATPLSSIFGGGSSVGNLGRGMLGGGLLGLVMHMVGGDTDMARGARGFFENIFSGLGEMVGGIFNPVVSNMRAEIDEAVGEGIQKLEESGKEIVGYTGQELDRQRKGLREDASEVMDDAEERISALQKDFFSDTKRLAEFVDAMVGGRIEEANEMISNHIKNVEGIAEDLPGHAADAVVDKIKAPFRAIGSWVGSAGSALSSPINLPGPFYLGLPSRESISRSVSGIGSAGRRAGDWVDDVMDKSIWYDRVPAEEAYEVQTRDWRGNRRKQEEQQQ